jgi:hypothetical protein
MNKMDVKVHPFDLHYDEISLHKVLHKYKLMNFSLGCYV